MKNMLDVEARVSSLKNRALEIALEFRTHADDPDKIIELADELTAIITEYEAHAGALEQIHAMAEYLISKNCSGPH